MRVLFDHQIFSLQSAGGISRYFAQLLAAFRSDDDVQAAIGLRFSQNRHLHELGLRTYTEPWPRLNFRGRGRLRLILNGAASRAALWNGAFDLFHPTYYSPYFLRYLKGRPFVLTIYDMTHEIFPHLMPASDRTAERKALLARKANAIIAISENTKADIVRLLGIDPSRIFVVHLANSLRPKLKPSLPYRGLPDRYLLHVGARDRYKNFPLLAKAASALMADDPELHLVCAGSFSFSQQENDLFPNASLLRRVHHLAPSDAELISIYQGALAFVLPSLYEGFGMPVLEAFACGCPAILSNGSSLPEVGANAALYFDPSSWESLRDLLAATIADEPLRLRLKEAGLRRAREFSWEKVAQETKGVYEMVLQDQFPGARNSRAQRD